MSVLIVDDVDLHLHILQDIVLDMGIYKTFTARNGQEAIEAAKEHRPDLILLDLDMPVMNGFEACYNIRDFADKVTMPIIVITGKYKTEDIEPVYKMGANDYLEKPFNVTEIKNRIAFHLEYSKLAKKLGILENYIHEDLQIARTIQKRSFPDVDIENTKLSKHGLSLAAYLDEEQLGGDTWNILYLACGTPVFCIMDITGHGINSAINNSYVTSMLQSVFKESRHLSPQDFQPRIFLEQLNEKLCEHFQIGTFCTGSCFLIRDNSIQYAGCAMPASKIIKKSSNEIQNIKCDGIPMGVTKSGFTPSNDRIEFKKGDILIMTTDGLTESAPKGDTIYTAPNNIKLPGEILLEEELDAIINETNEPSAQDTLDRIISRFKEKKFDLKSDDITVLTIKNI